MYDQVEAEMLVEVRGLALQMIRLEQWATEAARRQRWERVGECNEQRDRCRVRRSQLMLELWNARHRVQV